jgi:hypothetical protein
MAMRLGYNNNEDLFYTAALALDYWAESEPTVGALKKNTPENSISQDDNPIY